LVQGEKGPRKKTHFREKEPKKGSHWERGHLVKKKKKKVRKPGREKGKTAESEGKKKKSRCTFQGENKNPLFKKVKRLKPIVKARRLKKRSTTAFTSGEGRCCGTGALAKIGRVIAEGKEDGGLRKEGLDSKKGKKTARTVAAVLRILPWKKKRVFPPEKKREFQVWV